MRIVFLLTFLFSIKIHAAQSRYCDLALTDPAARATKAREIFMKEVRDNNLPAFVKQNQNGLIPVVLMNAQTEPALQDFIDHSVGTELMAKAGWPNNHGSFRYENNIIDAYIAGKRQVGEAHETGLSWKRLHDTNLFFEHIADVMVEIAYYVTPEEMTAVDYYQRVRRAALYRVIFAMGDLSIYNKFDNVLQSRIACFQFSKCTNVRTEAMELTQKVQAFEAGFGDFKQDPAAKAEFIKAAKAQLLAANAYDANALSEQTVSTGAAGEWLDKITPKKMDPRQRQLYANYLIGMDAANGFEAVRAALNISGDGTDADQINPRVTGILVYLKGDHAEAFRTLQARIGANGYQFNMQGAQPLK